MINGTSAATEQINGSLLYVGELLHRIANEYASAISLASGLAARSSSAEAREALREVIDHLHALAATHNLLRPPLRNGIVDLSGNIAQLCSAMASAGLEKRGIRFHLALTETITVEEKQCWHASLIIAELVTNAARHASLSWGGRVSVSIGSTSERIICRVRDSGSCGTTFNPGLGSLLVNALANGIHGRIERQFDSSGMAVTLSFPRQTRCVADRAALNQVRGML